MAKKSFSRDNENLKDDGKSFTNQVDDKKVQPEQAVNPTSDALDVEAPKTGFDKQHVKGKGAELKQQTISDVITGSNGASGMGFLASGRSVSGTAGGILGASNSTPRVDNDSRSKSRVGKKLDRVATKLNFTPCEQVLLDVDESKPLADAATEDQGFNGTYRNENARSQKNNGAVPADLMYQRSVDFITKDKLYFLEGQMLFQEAGDRETMYPSITVAINEDTGKAYDKDVCYRLGNYLHTGLHFGLNARGQVEYFYADVVDLTPDILSAGDANMASAHRLIKANVAELDRMAMDSAAGDEKADVWSPLPRAVRQPTKTSAFIASIEAVTGGYTYLAYCKACTNMAFQLNRGPKDGLNEVTPAMEELIGWRNYDNSQNDFKAHHGNVVDRNYVFNEDNYRKGDPAIMIDAYDSVAKYHNKADLLLQPRGWRMHIQTAANHLNALRVPQEFVDVFTGAEVFSTIEHEYDPSMPICMTDKTNLVIPFDLNQTCCFDNRKDPREIEMEWKFTDMDEYAHEDVYIVNADWAKRLHFGGFYGYYLMTSGSGYDTDPVPQYDSQTGIIHLKENGIDVGTHKSGLVMKFFEEPQDTTDVNSPVYGYTQLLAITNIDNLEHNIVFHKPVVATGGVITEVEYSAEYKARGVIRDGGEFAYAYSDLRNNYITQVKNPLINGLIDWLNNSIGAKIRELIKQTDFYIPMIFSTQFMTLAQLAICAATPWIERNRLESMKDVIYYEENIHTYPYSSLKSIKDTGTNNYLNFEFTDFDSPLQTKTLGPVQALNWVMPEFFWDLGDNKYVLPWYFNENDLDNDGTVREDEANMSMPSIRSGVRLGLLDSFYAMSEKDIRLSLDRITRTLLRDEDIEGFAAYKYGRTTDGQIVAKLADNKKFTIKKLLSAPRELGLLMEVPLGVLTIDPLNAHHQLDDFEEDGTSPSYTIKVYANPTAERNPSILDIKGVNISRGANYVQTWFSICSNKDTTADSIGGLVFGLGDDDRVFSPFAEIGTGAPSTEITTNVVSMQRAFNTRLQFLPFVISPFDNKQLSDGAYDIFDYAYFFGLCGFRASDYRESVYNREKQVVNEGLMFVKDPWVLDSPLLTRAAKQNGTSLTKGYELK